MQDLKQALRKLAKAVVVITAEHDGIRYAMSATAVSEVSMDPPTMLICVNHNAAISGALSSGAPFCLNILNATQEGIARVCGGGASGEDRFHTGEWERTGIGPFRLIDAEASIVCRQIHAVSIGTHDVFIGQVEEVSMTERCAPLVYVDGAYACALTGQI